MEKRDPATDSEDEAFESADEGENDDGPSPTTAHGTLHESGPSTGSSDSKAIVKCQREMENTIEDSSGSVMPKVDDVLVEEKVTEDGNGSKPEVGKNAELPGKTETSKEAVAIDREVGEDVDTVCKPDISALNEGNVAKLSENEGHDAMKDGHKEKDEAEEPTEPSMEQIHESTKEDEGDMPVSQAMDRLAEGTSHSKEREDAESGASGWGWGGWGSMISKATSSVSTMLETVETQLGIPSPTEMAKLATSKLTEKMEEPQVEEKAKEDDADVSASNHDKNKALKEPSDAEKDNSGSGAGLGSWLSGLGVSQISTLVQNTGKEIVSGSLDALEFVGKKTFDAISHGDPALRRKRMTLSQAIREAKEKAEQNTQVVDENTMTTFSVEFDKFQGLAHLEALEMISRESEAELEKHLELSSEESMKDTAEMIEMLKEKFKISEKDETEDTEINELEGFEGILTEQVATLSLSVTPAKLIAAYATSTSKSEKGEGETVLPDDFFSDTITCFAEMTARSVELFHKVGELMLLPDVKASFLAKARANALSTICATLREAMSTLSIKFATTLNESQPEKDDKISKILTDIYLEASNSSAYIDDSYHLLLPIFQLSAVKNSS